MSWSLIRSIKDETDLRLVMPFGLRLHVGDVVSVDRKSGGLTLEGTAQSILAASVSQRNQPSRGKISFTTQYGDQVEVKLRASGVASSLFDGLPQASAGADISFASANSWLLAVTGRNLAVLSNTAELRLAILSAYERKVWQPDWVLVNSIASVDRMTLLASKSSDTNIALNFSGDTSPGTALEASLTANASIAATNKDITHYISTSHSTAFFSGLRVKDRWLKDPDVEVLSGDKSLNENEFWEDSDEMGG